MLLFPTISFLMSSGLVPCACYTPISGIANPGHFNLRYRGSDASWEHDKEPPPTCVDFSDDEEERSGRRTKKNLTRNLDKTGPVSLAVSWLLHGDGAHMTRFWLRVV